MYVELHPRGTQTCTCGHSGTQHAWTDLGDWCNAEDCPCPSWHR